MAKQFRSTGAHANEFDLQAVLLMIRRNVITIIVCVILSTVLAALYVIDTDSLYTATASVLIDPYRSQSALVPQPLSDSPVDAAVVDTQVELIKSEAVARLAIRKLGDSAEALLTGGPTKSYVKSIRTSVSAWIKAHAKHEKGDAAPDPVIELIQDMNSSLYVKRVGLTFVITVAFQGATATGSADVANAITDAYLEDQINAKLAAAQRVSAALADRASELRNLAQEADRKVQAYQGGDRVTIQQLSLAAQAARATYDVFQRRAMETEQAGENSPSQARFVSRASPPDNRSWPRSSLLLIAGLVSGGGVGVVISFTRQTFGRFYKNAGDVEADFGEVIGRLVLRNGGTLRRKLRRGDTTRY